MSSVYIMHPDGRTEAMTRIRCQNEEQELQTILERNPDLLPGDQIDPTDPRRWLLIKREMPVPDPNTGQARWNVDFLFADQDAIPTFVECKRFADTRSRREVIGQMLEYAANGPYYWKKDDLRTFAEGTAKGQGISLQARLQALQPNDTPALDEFFEQMEQNLREGQLRIVFFLEESPMELRSLVDFLNKQMERTEVLLVEARQFGLNDARIVAPTLFGYTEEARQVKRHVTVTTATSRRSWDETSFFEDAMARLPAEEVKALRTLYQEAGALGYELNWGTGQTAGSFTVKHAAMHTGSLLSVYSNGRLTVNFGGMSGTEVAEHIRGELAKQLSSRIGLRLPDDFAKRYLTYQASEWTPKVEELAHMLRELVEREHSPTMY